MSATSIPIFRPMTAKARQLAQVKGHVNVGTKVRKKPRKYGKLADFVGKGGNKGK